MTATTTSTALATIQPAFTDVERLALAGFLAGDDSRTAEDPHHHNVRERRLCIRRAGEIEALSRQDRERLHAAVARLSQPLLVGGEVRSQMASHLVIARR